MPTKPHQLISILDLRMHENLNVNVWRRHTCTLRRPMHMHRETGTAALLAVKQWMLGILQDSRLVGRTGPLIRWRTFLFVPSVSLRMLSIHCFTANPIHMHMYMYKCYRGLNAVFMHTCALSISMAMQK